MTTMTLLTASLSSTSIDSTASSNSNCTSGSTASSTRFDKSHTSLDPKFDIKMSGNGLGTEGVSPIVSLDDLSNNNNNIVTIGKEHYLPGESIVEERESIARDGSFNSADSASEGSGLDGSTPKPERIIAPTFDLRKRDVRERPSRPTSVKMFQFHLSPSGSSANPVDRTPSTRSLNPTKSLGSKVKDEENLLKQMKSRSVVLDDLAQGLFDPDANRNEVRFGELCLGISRFMVSGHVRSFITLIITYCIIVKWKIGW